VLVADYRNYAPDPDAPLASLESLAALLEEGQLELVSEVILEDVRVEPLLTR
jgi:hypothetical protein